MLALEKGAAFFDTRDSWKMWNLQQLHEMFKDLALMVEQQGEMLNNIEKNVEQARDYVADAERECHQAVDLTNKWRKVCSDKFHRRIVY